MQFLPYLHQVVRREALSVDGAHAAMTLILKGEVSTPLLTAFLTALKMKGETVDELRGFAQAMREQAAPVRARTSGPLLDTCGTGGDGLGTFNISTVTAFVVAGAGVRVAKHGNRSISSRCGSADVFQALGVHLHLSPADMAQCLDEVGIAFLLAPAVHPAMRHAQPARQELKMPTAFNLLGPLCNPASADVQLLGAPSRSTAHMMAQVLARLGTRRARVVHGDDGLDEITTTAATTIYLVEEGEVNEERVEPELFGVPRASLSDLQGGDVQHNCDLALRILQGERGAPRDVVLVNAAAALVTAGVASDYRAGVQQAKWSIDSGAARESLEKLAVFTQARLQPEVHGR